MDADLSFQQIKPPELRLLYTSTIQIDPPLLVGEIASGVRRIINISGGTFKGPRMTGQVLRGGADWQIIKSDGVTEVEAKYTLKTDDGALIYISNWGLRHGPKAVMEKMIAGEYVEPDQYYFRMTPRFESGDERYRWLNRVVAVATGERHPDAVIITVFEVY